MPWLLPADLEYFRKKTLGHPVIMGRKTHESIGRILPGRKNIVISSQKGYRPIVGAFLAKNLKEALALAGRTRCYIIGGARVYEEALPLADRIYLTAVDHCFMGDTVFPKIYPKKWRKIRSKMHYADHDNPYQFAWKVYERVKK